VPIKIDVSPLMQEVGQTSHLSLQERVTYPDDGLDIVEPIIIEADLLNSGEILVLDAKVSAKIKLECGRCLEKFVFQEEIGFLEEYSHEISLSPKGKGERELTKEDFIFKIDKENMIDLGEAVRQNLLTQLPIKPLCKECSEKED